jgi:hypothetical protein
MIRKFIVVVALGFVTYKALWYYTGYRFVSQIGKCGDAAEIARLQGDASSDNEKRAYLRKAFACVQAQQNLIDRVFVHISDDTWADKVDLPATK